MFSGDKLLGGPQAGIIAGKRDLVARIRRHPLFRALRVDKLTIAALEATLGAYLRAAHDEIPSLRMIHLSATDIQHRAENFLRDLNAELPLGKSAAEAENKFELDRRRVARRRRLHSRAISPDKTHPHRQHPPLRRATRTTPPSRPRRNQRHRPRRIRPPHPRPPHRPPRARAATRPIDRRRASLALFLFIDLPSPRQVPSTNPCSAKQSPTTASSKNSAAAAWESSTKPKTRSSAASSP